MALTQEEYEKLRASCINKYSKLYNDTLAFDLCEVTKDIRIRLLNDPYYIAKTKAHKAHLFETQIDLLDEVINGEYAEEGRDQSAIILKALEMKQKLLLQDVGNAADDSSALNVTYTEMSRADFEAMETIEVNEGSNNAELGADFGLSEDNDSFEARMKAQTQERLKELNNGTANKTS